MSDTMDMELEFRDATFFVHGRLVDPLTNSEIEIEEDGCLVERAQAETIAIDIERGYVEREGRQDAIEPGRYLVTGQGLFRRVLDE